MKIIATIIFLNLILFSAGFNAVVWIYYELNVESLTEQYCVNKDRADLDCKGKCQIEKILIEEQNIPLEQQQVVEYLPSAKFFINKAETFSFNTIPPVIKITPYLNLYKFEFVNSFLKPPRS